MTPPTERPKSWANWRAHTEGERARTAHEFDLHSDSTIHGTARDFGPYRLMNLRAGERKETALSRPVMVLRAWYSAHPDPREADAEHGKREPDEIAALVSLVLGIRLQAGGETRHLDREDDEEPFGEPRAQAEVQTPVMPQGPWTQVVGHARRTAELCELDLLDTYPLLDATAATALVRAARLYQEALWISEREPWLAWLLLVSAVETAANTHKHDTGASPADLLRELDPRLAKAAEKYGESCVSDIAKTQVKLLGATKKFLDFLEGFLPDAPATRPKEYRLDWTKEGLRGPLKKVYGMRSAYLHAGIPFPWQLRGAPEPCGDVPTETHPDHVEEAARRDGTKVSDPSLPMHLHVFEYIARGALLGWWSKLSSGN